MESLQISIQAPPRGIPGFVVPFMNFFIKKNRISSGGISIFPSVTTRAGCNCRAKNGKGTGDVCRTRAVHKRTRANRTHTKRASGAPPSPSLPSPVDSSGYTGCDDFLSSFLLPGPSPLCRHGFSFPWSAPVSLHLVVSRSQASQPGEQAHGIDRVSLGETLLRTTRLERVHRSSVPGSRASVGVPGPYCCRSDRAHCSELVQRCTDPVPASSSRCFGGFWGK